VSVRFFATVSIGVNLTRKPIWAYVLQVIVIANHMSGKDTHVRGLRVLGPEEWVIILNQTLDNPLTFISL